MHKGPNTYALAYVFTGLDYFIFIYYRILRGSY